MPWSWGVGCPNWMLGFGFSPLKSSKCSYLLVNECSLWICYCCTTMINVQEKQAYGKKDSFLLIASEESARRGRESKVGQPPSRWPGSREGGVYKGGSQDLLPRTGPSPSDILPSSGLHLLPLIIPSYYEALKGLAHCLGQGPWALIISRNIS